MEVSNIQITLYIRYSGEQNRNEDYHAEVHTQTMHKSGANF